MENGVVKEGKKGKSQGIEGSANTNDVWVWMMPHIGFFTIGKCDLLPFFLLIKYLPVACKFYHLSLSLFETWSFFIWCFTSYFSVLTPPFFRESFFC
jgi:hypothetical protein